MHVVIHPSVLCVVRVVFLGGKAKVWCKSWIPKKGSDAFNDVAVKNFARFGPNLDHVTLETWTTRKFFINDCIQLPCILERQSKFIRYLLFKRMVS